MIANQLEPLADAVARRQADQDVRGANIEFDRLARSVKEVPLHLRHKQANKQTMQVALALVREARSRHGT